MKLISRNELRTLLLGVTASTIVSMVCVTEPDMRAKDADKNRNPYLAGLKLADGFTIGKVIKVNGNIAGRYDSMVENRLAKAIEADRMAANLPALNGAELQAAIDESFRKGESWHRPIMDDDSGKPTCLSVNKKDNNDGPAYLRFVFKAKGEAEYVRHENGASEPTENVAPFLSPSSDYGNQGLGDDKVIFVMYKLENIVEIAIGGQRYRVADNFTDRSMPMRERVWDIAEQYLDGERTMAKVQ